jgi:shikimate dehydrogenase
MDTNAEKIYGLIGFPLTHSFSQNYFNQKFEAENIAARYLNFELPDIGDFMEVLSEYPELNGMNVTIPYKEQVIPYLNELDEDAAKIGAVNVIKFIRVKNSLKLKGYNSDVIGFSDSIAPLLGERHKKALVLGTGGASKAIVRGLENLGVEPTLVSRTPRQGVLTYGDLTAEVMADHLVIVNTTPLGMYPHMDACPDIPYELLTPDHLCYDLLYNPDVTKFMKLSAEHGAETKNGLEMLLLQAFASWRIWNE